MGDLGSARSDFITPVVGKVNESKKNGITRKELNTNGLAIVIAGCQLPTVALAASTYLMLRYPNTLKELTREIRTNFDSEKDITISSTQNLPYLGAVINETLRIHHPTPINLPRITVPEGQMVDGDFIPGNVRIISTSAGPKLMLNAECHWRESPRYSKLSRKLGRTPNFSPRTLLTRERPSL